MSPQIDLLKLRRSRRCAAPLAGAGAAAAALTLAVTAAFAQAPPAASPPPVSAKPVSYTLNVSAGAIKGGQGVLKTDIATLIFMQRYDTTVKLPSGSTFHVINLLDCTANKITTIDPDLNIYTVNDSTQVRPEFFGTGTLLPSYTVDGRGLLFPLPDLVFASQTGGVGANVAVTDKGMESVGKTKNAHHYTVSFTYSTTGAAEVPYPSQTFEVWTDDTEMQPPSCIAGRILQAGASGTPAQVGGVAYTLTGDVAKLSTVMTQVPVQITYDTGGAAGTITYSLDKLSDKSPDPKLFDAPSGKMKQVSASDFAVDERNALKARVQGENGDVNDSSAAVRNIAPSTDPRTQGIDVPPTMGAN